jgi:hypothetical protein
VRPTAILRRRGRLDSACRTDRSTASSRPALACARTSRAGVPTLRVDLTRTPIRMRRMSALAQAFRGSRLAIERPRSVDITCRVVPSPAFRYSAAAGCRRNEPMSKAVAPSGTTEGRATWIGGRASAGSGDPPAPCRSHGKFDRRVTTMLDFFPRTQCLARIVEQSSERCGPSSLVELQHGLGPLLSDRSCAHRSTRHQITHGTSYRWSEPGKRNFVTFFPVSRTFFTMG